MVAAPAITLGLEEGGYLTGSVAREVLLGVVPGSMSAPGLAGGWDLPLGLLSSPRDKLQGTVSVNLSATGDSTDQEMAKWNVAASFWWTHMPIYGPEMLLRILRGSRACARIFHFRNIRGFYTRVHGTCHHRDSSECETLVFPKMLTFCPIIGQIESRQRVFIYLFFKASFACEFLVLLLRICEIWNKQFKVLEPSFFFFLICWRRLINVFSHHSWSAHHVPGPALSAYSSSPRAPWAAPISTIILQMGTRGAERVSDSFKVRWIINVELEFTSACSLRSPHSWSWLLSACLKIRPRGWKCWQTYPTRSIRWDQVMEGPCA